MVRWDYFADVRPTGQTPLSLVGVTRYPAHTAGFAVGQNIAWGTASYATPRAHRRRMDGLAPAPGDHPHAPTTATPASPRPRRCQGVLRAGRGGATYAMEFGVRHF